MSEIDRVLKAVFMIEEFRTGIDDDFVDRLNRQWAPSILVVFTILLSIKQIVGDPINCWCPAQFVKAHVVSINTVGLLILNYSSVILLHLLNVLNDSHRPL